MWVEITQEWDSWEKSRSSSLWGCELKFLNPETQQWENNVILLVRMWVEIYISDKYLAKEESSSLWGRVWGAITTSHSDSMSGVILAFFYLSREDSNFYKWWVIRNIPQGESIISDRDKMFRKDVQRFWGEYVSLSWPESCTKSHVHSI